MAPLHRRITLLAAVAALAVAPASADAQDTEHTLSVVGTGEVELTPDRGSFSASVERRAATAADAQAQAGRIYRKVIAGLRAVPVPAERITTTSVSVSRVRRRPTKTGPVRHFYRASASVTVTVDGIKLLGRAIDAASRGGASDVYGPDLSFTPALRTQGQRQADAAALVDARARADAAAAAEGQRIVEIRSIVFDPDADGSFDSSSGAGAALNADASAPIQPGRQTLASQARVTFVIEPTG